MLDDDAKMIQAAYWEMEKPWQAYRSKTGDTRAAVDCRDGEIRESARRFMKLFEKFKNDRPAPPCMAWGILPSGIPFLYEPGKPL